MADCCQQLSARLSALESAIAALKPVNEEEIINKAILGSKAAIIPLIGTIAYNLLGPKIQAALGVAEAANLAANRASLEAAFAKSSAVAAQAEAAAAAGQASNAAATAGSAIAKALAALAAIAGVLAAVAALESSGARIDAVENELQHLGNDVSGVLGRLLGLQNGINAANQRVLTPGPKGDNGARGPQGIPGVKGDTGLKGDKGEKGLPGVPGVQGIQGLKGEQGEKGNIGGRGEKGLQGVPGNKGERGIPGAIGERGAKGETGKEGERGVPGPQGISGVQGIPGKSGPQGIPGITGANGSLGAKGLTGDPGKPGTNGQPGKDGKPGVQGIPGVKGLPGKDGKDGRDGKDGKSMTDEDRNKLNQILALVGFIVAGITAITGKLPIPLSASNLSSAAKQGVCQSAQPGECLFNALQNQASDLKSKLNDLKQDIGSKINAALQADIFAVVNIINAKLGIQLPGGISNFLNIFKQGFDLFQSWEIGNKVADYANLVLTLQIAFQLTEGLGSITSQTFGNILQVFGLKDPKGENINIGKYIEGGIENLIDKTVGKDIDDALKAEWKTANKIFNASANVLNAMQAMFYSLFNALNVIGSWVGQIGDALKKWGVVGFNAFPWMNAAPNFHNKYFTAVFAINDVLTQIDTVAQSIIGGRQQLDETSKQLTDLRESLVNETNQPVPDNKAASQQNSKGLVASKAKKPSDAELASISGE